MHPVGCKGPGRWAEGQKSEDALNCGKFKFAKYEVEVGPGLDFLLLCTFSYEAPTRPQQPWQNAEKMREIQVWKIKSWNLALLN